MMKRDVLIKTAAIALCAAAVVLLVLFLLTRGSGTPEENTPAPTETLSGTEEPTASPEPVGDPDRIVILSLGDIMFGPEQIDAASADRDFSASFGLVSPVLAQADIVIGSLDGAFAGEEKGYADVLGANVPDTAARALKEAGIDVVCLADEKVFSYGTEGALRTVGTARSAGLVTAGIAADETENRFALIEVKGVTVAVLSVSCDLDVSVPSYMITEASASAVTAEIAAAREAGASVVVVQIEWGSEFSDDVTDAQKELAQAMLDAGASAVFGSHTHAVSDIRCKNVLGREALVCYGLGNFLSSQRAEGRERGIIGGASFDLSGFLRDAFYVPVWVQPTDVTGAPVYRVVPAGAYASEPRSPELSVNDFETVVSVWESIKERLGEENARAYGGN